LDSKLIWSNTTNCSGYRNDGLAATLNAANFAGCIAVNKSFELDHPEVVKDLTIIETYQMILLGNWDLC
jgi:hypothetical protein